MPVTSDRLPRATQIATRLDEAERLACDGRHIEAERLCQAVLSDDTECLRAYVLLYQLGRRQRQSMQALGWLFSAIDLAPDDLVLRLDQAELLIEVGRWSEARALLLRLHASRPLDSQICLRLGLIERHDGRRDAARTWFQRAFELAPSDVAACLAFADELIAAGDVSAARDILSRLPPSALTNAATRLRLSHLARASNDRAEALAHLRFAFELEPNLADIRCWLVTECREQGLLQDAAALIAASPSDAAGSLHMMLERGRLARARGDADEASAAFALACDAYPRSGDAWTNLALAQLALADPEAGASLARAIEVEPGHLEAGLHLASWLREQGRWAESRAICQELRLRHPDAEAIWLVESRAIQADLGPAAALAHLDEAEAALGANQEIWARRIEIELRSGSYERVRARLREVEPSRELHLEYCSALIQGCLLLGSTQACDDLLRRLPVATAASQARECFLRGMLAERCWTPAEALRHYRAALAIDPTAGPIHQDIARVAMITLDIEAAWAGMQRYISVTGGERRIRGEQRKPRHTHVGQILDEYRLDPATVERLRCVRDLPPPLRIGALRTLARDYPLSTPIACTLMLTLREAGLLNVRPAIQARPIPRTIFQFWAQGAPDEDVAGMMQSWRDHNPSYTYWLLNDTTAREWLRRHAAPKVLQAYQRASSFAQRSDLLRLALLAREGGFYADADDRCVGAIDGVVPQGCQFLAYQEEYLTIGNNLLGCVPGQAIVLTALAGAVAAINAGDKETLWLSTGPGLLTRSFAQHFAQATDASTWMQGIAVMDRPSLSGVVAMHCDARYKTTGQHWLRDLSQRRSGPYASQPGSAGGADRLRQGSAAGTPSPGAAAS